MSVQTSYGEMVKGFKGMLAEPFSLRQIDSGLVESAALGLGVAVKAGSANGQYVAAAADDAVLGMVVYEPTQEVSAGADYEYGVKDQVPVLKKGRIYAVANAALARGAAVAYDPATGKVGAVSGGVSTLAFATVIEASAADGDLITIELNF